MGEAIERIALAVLGISLLMTLIASILPGGTSLVEPFSDIDPITGIGSFFAWVGDAGLGLIQFFLQFLQAPWSAGFPDWIHWIVLVVVDVALLLLVSSNIPLLVVAGVAALVAAIEAIIPG